MQGPPPEKRPVGPVRKLACGLGHVLTMPLLVEPRWEPALHQEARQVLGTALVAWSSAACPAQVWLELAIDQDGRRAYGAARRSLERTLAAHKAHSPLTDSVLSQAHLLLALLVLGGRHWSRAEKHLRAALAADAANAYALWHLGQLEIHQGDATGGEAHLRSALAAMAGGPSAVVLGVVHSEGARREREEQAAADQRAFESFCASSPALTHHVGLPARLGAALANLKQCVHDVEWLLKWGVESTLLFGPYGPQFNAAAYGETPFLSWQRVMARPAVVAAVGSAASQHTPPSRPAAPANGAMTMTTNALCDPDDGCSSSVVPASLPPASSPPVSSPPSSAPLALICGCALGYMGLYFRAIGMTCLGVDLLADSMVATCSQVC